MTPDRWEYTTRYLRDVFGGQDDHLEGLMDRAVDAGLPAIAVSPDVGHLLGILVSLTPGRRALELGTLAGYSAIWVARGLAPGGTLTTVEFDPAHAAFARGELERAGVADRVEVVEGPALDVVPRLSREWGPESVDFAFVDAVKSEYVRYFDLIKPMIAPGGLFVADNVLGTGQGWIDEGFGTDEMNRRIAADPDFDSVAVPIREGILIARRRPQP